MKMATDINLLMSTDQTVHNICFGYLHGMFGQPVVPFTFSSERRELREIRMRGLDSASLTNTLGSRG